MSRKSSFKTFPSLNVVNEFENRQYFDLTIGEALTATADQSKRSLKTFTGVFCPVALAQFSSLLFLRLGCVLGQAGLLISLLQLVMAYTIVVLTVLSICAISTNGAVKGGGVYFMISRTLGPEVGGSIGLLFFLANVFSSALYMAGFVECLVDNFGTQGRIHPGIVPDGVWWTYLFNSCVCLFCLAVCLVGGSMFARTNLFIFLAVFVCFASVVLSFIFQKAQLVKIPRINHVVYTNDTMPTVYGNYTGFNGHTFASNLYYSGYETDFTVPGSQMSFLGVFAILFSGVTGIMNGANMSGELKQPAVAIPWGTLGATTFTFVCYILCMFFTMATCERFLLLNNYLYMQAINFWFGFVMVGIFCTCLSAGLGNLIGASRILFALAKDDIFGILLRPAKMATQNGNPIAAVLISFVLVQLVLFIGKLNLIAPVVSVFFLLAYAAVNLACGLLDLASASNFRPTFKYFSWHTSILGVVCCVGMCILVNYQYAIGIFVLFIVLIFSLNFRQLDYAWGSIGQALLYHQVRKYLLLIDVRKAHIKYWRPQILLLMSNPRSQASLVQFINLLKKGGLFILGHVINADLDKLDKDPAADIQKNMIIMKDYLKVKAFVDVTTSNSVRDGCQQLIRLCGLGGMTVNTVCLGFRDDSEPQDVLMMMDQKSTVRQDWPLHSYTNATMTDDIDSPQNQNNAATYVNMHEEQQRQFTTNVGENSPLVQKKGLRWRANNIRLKYFTNILSPPIDSKFINELPKLRSPKSQHHHGLINQSPSTDFSGQDIVDHKPQDSAEQDVGCEQISEIEYVGIIADSIKLQKNVCLCRSFNRLDLDALARSTDNWYIDVWPINFFQPGSGSYLDKTCMFMLQLSCILSMSTQLNSRCRIRVYICLDYYTETANNKNIIELWNELLLLWRIQAEIKTVAWDDIIVNLEHKLGRTLKPSATVIPLGSLPETRDNTKTISQFDCNLPTTYVREVNGVIRSRTSESTAVCFLYLPELPDCTDVHNWRRYLDQLTALTEDLPPSVLVRGQHEVITAAL